MDKEKIPMIGGSSLLVIFAVLCLTVFALLGYSTVAADLRLSNASAEAVTAYYEAEARAEEILAALRAGELPSCVHTDGDIYSYTCTISDTQELQVAVRIRGAEYEILRWNAAATAERMEQSLTVWDGERETK